MRSLSLLVPVVFLGACAGSGMSDGSTPSNAASGVPIGSPSDAESQPTSDSVDSLTGRLGASGVEGGCPYLETDEGTRFEVVYPTGWRVDRQTGTLYDPRGEAVAGPGDVITVHGSRADDMVSICQVGPMFRATEVDIAPG